LSANSMAPLQPRQLSWTLATTISALDFFYPLKNAEVRAELGLPANPLQQILPLRLLDFISYLQKEDSSVWEYAYQVVALVSSLVRAGILVELPNGTPPFANCYYTIFPGTTRAQASGYMWLAPAVGPELVIRTYGASTIPITGKDSTGNDHIGTGLILDENHVLTNAHVVADLTLDEVFETSSITSPLERNEATAPGKLRRGNVHAHPEIDVAVLEIEHIKGAFTSPQGVAFREPSWIDQILTFGYPPVPLTPTAALLVHKGEVVNPSVKSYRNEQFFLYSATTRPGNSGGPIVAQDGRVVGIIAHSVETVESSGTSEQECSDSENTASTEMQAASRCATGRSAPFYRAIPTSEIARAFDDMGLNGLLPVETWKHSRDGL